MSTRWESGRRPVAAVLIVLVMLVAGCTQHSASPRSASTTTSSANRGQVGAAFSEHDLVELFADSGVATVSGESSTHPQVAVKHTTGIEVTSWQARNMAMETRSHGGIPGSSLDAAFPLGAGAPPLAFVIGAWASVKPDATAKAAARLLGSQDWHHAEAVIFPTAVLQLFVADVVAHAGTTKPSTASSSSSGSPATTATRPTHTATRTRTSGVVANIAMPLAATSGLTVAGPVASCSGVASFVDGVLNTVFGALKVNPVDVYDWVSGKIGGTVGVVVGVIAGFFASFWNKAVDFAEATVRGVLTALTAPVLNTLRTVIGALETITTVMSYLRRWNVPLTAQPTSNSFSITGHRAHRGIVTATIDRNGETEDWPDLLTDCATTLGKPPPTLSSEGMPVTWSTVQQQAGLISVDRPTPPAVTGTLDKNLSDHLDYTTNSETAKLASSPLVASDTVTVTAQIRRTEIEQLSNLLVSYLSANFPPILQPTVRSILGTMFGWAKTALDSITAVNGSTAITITHHLPKPPTTTTIPKPSRVSGPIDLCREFPVSTIAAATGRGVYTTATERNGNSAGASLYACEYTDTTNPADALDAFSVAVYRGGDPDQIMKTLAGALNSGATATSGIGDRAQIGDGEIDVVVGTDVVVVSDTLHMGNLTDLDPSVLRALAQKVIAKL